MNYGVGSYRRYGLSEIKQLFDKYFSISCIRVSDKILYSSEFVFILMKNK